MFISRIECRVVRRDARADSPEDPCGGAPRPAAAAHARRQAEQNLTLHAILFLRQLPLPDDLAILAALRS